MRAKLEEVSKNFSQLIIELREEGFSVVVDAMKTILKVKVEYNKIEIAEVKVRKTAKNLAKAFDVLQSILLLSETIRKLFQLANALNLNIKQLIKITIKHEFDITKLKSLINSDFASVSTLSLREHARQKIKELEELAEVAEINYTYEYTSSYEITLLNYSDLMQALSELTRIKENYSEYRQAINTVVQLVSDYVKAANKLTQKDNSEYLKHKKQLRELEIRALECGDYEKVSDKTIKELIKSTFTEFSSEKIKVLDKSSKLRAVLFCTLYLSDDYYPRLLPCFVLYLAGEDDNGETWIHAVNCMHEDNQLKLYNYTVEDAESLLLDIPHSTFKRFVARQGDVFVFKDEEQQTNYKEQEETDEFEILPNHILKLEKTAVIKYKRKRNRIYIDLPVPAILEHPSHHHVELPPAKYLFVHVVSSHDQPVD